MAVVEAGASAMRKALKKTGYEWYRSLGSPKYFVAPMVAHSELAYRLLTREYGAQMTVTPMIHAKRFLDNEKLRQSFFDSWEGDWPLTAQFCANDPEVLVEAAKLVQHAVAAVDINLGCPQGIARRGFYGSFLLEHQDLVASMVARCAEELSVPVTVKIRLLPDLQDTFAFVDAMVEAGASLLTVHGRTRFENKTLCHAADWEAIKAIKARLSIPVVANGGMFNQGDVARCLVATGVDGVMLSEAVLENPGVFTNCVHLPTGEVHNAFDMTWRYLEIAEAVGAEWKHVQGHTLKMLFGGFSLNPDLQHAMPAGYSGDMYKHARGIIRQLAARFQVPLVDTPQTTMLVSPTSLAGARILANARANWREAYMSSLSEYDRQRMSAEQVIAREAAVEAGGASVMREGSVVVPHLPLPADPAVAEAAMTLPPVPLTAAEVPGAVELGAQATTVPADSRAHSPAPSVMAGAAAGVPAGTGTRPHLMREVVAWGSGNLEIKAAMELSSPTDLAFPRPGMWYYRHAPRVVAAALSPCATVAEAMLDIALQRCGRFRTHVVRDVGALKVYLRAKHGKALGLPAAQVARPTPPGTRGMATSAGSATPAEASAMYTVPALVGGVPFVEDAARRGAAAGWLANPGPPLIAPDLMQALVDEMVPLPMMDEEEAAALAAGEVTVEELGGSGPGTGTAATDQPVDEVPLHAGMQHMFGSGEDDFVEE